MPTRPQHARNCPAVWRGFYVTLFDRVPEDAPCTCGAEQRGRANTALPEGEDDGMQVLAA
jgi:hypothetical protein